MPSARLASAFAALGVALAAPSADVVKSLPGWDGPLPSKHYSGYLDASETKHLHYYYVEKEGPDAATAPVVIWLNGGPGCSSLDGFFYEHGPFRIDATTNTLVRFNYTWAKLANLLYIEAPVGVGFSYSDDPTGGDYDQNDDKSSQDNLAAVESFYKKFPELKPNGLVITGESYAGVYVPTLAEAITWAVGNGTYSGADLRAIAVGNGCTGTEIGVCGGQRDRFSLEYLLATAFVPQETKLRALATCNLTRGSTLSPDCEAIFQNDIAPAMHGINIYNVYGPCIKGLPPATSERAGKAPLGATLNPHLGSGDACIDSIAASAYVNRPEVIAALNVKPIKFTWATCASAPGWKYTSTRPNLPRDTYPGLLNFGVNVTIYNGDWDLCVPYTDNEAWTAGMGLPVKAPWHPWTFSRDGLPNSQIGGYATVYDGGLTFITIRGGRHEVPETAPERAFAMLKNVLAGNQF